MSVAAKASFLSISHESQSARNKVCYADEGTQFVVVWGNRKQKLNRGIAFFAIEVLRV